MTQLCEMCETVEAKYKCPTCRVPYCSIVCCKEHKGTPCEPVPASEKPQEPPTSAPIPLAIMSDDKDIEMLTAEQMAVLRTSMEVKKQLANPAITQTLTQVCSLIYSRAKMKMYVNMCDGVD